MSFINPQPCITILRMCPYMYICKTVSSRLSIATGNIFDWEQIRSWRTGEQLHTLYNQILHMYDGTNREMWLMKRQSSLQQRMVHPHINHQFCCISFSHYRSTLFRSKCKNVRINYLLLCVYVLLVFSNWCSHVYVKLQVFVSVCIMHLWILCILF